VNQPKVLVVTHALFFLDRFGRSHGREQARERGILPNYQVAILDEAHNLEDVAAEHLGLQIARGQIDYHLNKLLHERKIGSGGTAIGGLLSLHGDGDTLDQVYRVRHETERFFQNVLAWHADHEARYYHCRPPRD